MQGVGGLFGNEDRLASTEGPVLSSFTDDMGELDFALGTGGFNKGLGAGCAVMGKGSTILAPRGG